MVLTHLLKEKNFRLVLKVKPNFILCTGDIPKVKWVRTAENKRMIKDIWRNVKQYNSRGYNSVIRHGRINKIDIMVDARRHRQTH